MVYVSDGGGGETGGGEDGERAALARHHIFTVAEKSVLTCCFGLGGIGDHFLTDGLVWWGCLVHWKLVGGRGPDPHTLQWKRWLWLLA